MSDYTVRARTWLLEPAPRTDWWLALAVFVAAVLISWVAWSLLPAAYQENQSTDYTSFYEPVARSIANGNGIVLNGEMATRYPPGFPLILAGAFEAGRALGVSDAGALVWFRLLCAGLSAVLVYGLARLVWLPLPSLVAALAWATYPFGLWLTKQPNSEVAFIPLMLGAAYLLWRALLRSSRAWWLYLGAGLLVGAAMLVRPAAIGLGVVFALLVLLFARDNLRWPAKVGFAALLLAGNLVLVVPWQAAVYRQTGEFIPLSSGGDVTIKDGLTYLLNLKEYRREVDLPDDLEALMSALYERRPEMNSMGQLVAVVADEARKDPVAFAKLMGSKVSRSWYGTDSREFEGATLVLQIVYLLLTLWGSVYAVRRGGDLRRMIAGNWLIAAYFWLMTILVVPLMRYMLPVMPLLLIALPGVYYSLADLRLKRGSQPTPAFDPES